MTVLIGLNGYKRSGKNTAGGFIENWGNSRGLVVEQRGFADAVKLSAARSLGLYGATNINDAIVLMDSLKESGQIDIVIPEQTIMKSITGREFLKWFATEGHRDVFGPDFWVNELLPASWQLTCWENPDIAVITDVRFANEARRIRELGGVVWNIDRGYDPDEHASEQPLPSDLIDAVIPNRDTLESFEVAVRTMMTGVFHERFMSAERS